MNQMVASPKWLLMVIVVAVVFAIISSMRRRKWMQRNFDIQICPHCGQSQPPHAAYCRKCGQRI